MTADVIFLVLLSLSLLRMPIVLVVDAQKTAMLPETRLLLANNFSWNGLSTSGCLQVKTTYEPKSIYCCKVHTTDQRDNQLRQQKAKSSAASLLETFIGFESQKAQFSTLNAGATTSNKDGDVKVACVPHFIIAGAQKTGTTALSALLASIPMVSFHPKKEAHYFDKQDYYKKGLNAYLDTYKPWNYTESVYPPMYGESSPFYIASRVACQRIAKDLPHARIIFMLREPVARAYSEYQMKKRRVDSQNTFIRLVTENSHAVFDCLVKFEEDAKAKGKPTYSLLKECLPLSITSHNHYSKFIKALTNIKEHKVGGNTVEACFKEGKENHLRTSTTARSKSVREKFNAKRKGKGQGQLQRRLIDESSNKTVEEEYEGPYDVDPEEEGTEVEAEVESVESQEEEGLPDVADHREREDGDDDNDKESATTVGSFEYIKYLDESGAVRLQRKLTAALGNRQFQPTSCLDKFGKEQLSDLKTAFEDEAEFFKTCMTTHAASSQLAHLNLAIDKCFTIKGGIAAQFVYRSVYAIQLHNCFKHINRSNVHVVISEQMQRDPEQALLGIFRFLGFPQQVITDFMSSSSSIAGNVTEMRGAVVKHFPKFEATTGWSVDGTYEELEGYYRKKLQEFFKPYNEMLYNLLGIPPIPEWSYDKQ